MYRLKDSRNVGKGFPLGNDRCKKVHFDVDFNPTINHQRMSWDIPFEDRVD